MPVQFDQIPRPLTQDKNMNDNNQKESPYDRIVCRNCEQPVVLFGSANPTLKICNECNKSWIARLVRKSDRIGTKIAPPPVPISICDYFWSPTPWIPDCLAKKIYNSLGVLAGIAFGFVSVQYLLHHSSLPNIAVGLISIAVACVSSFMLYCLTSALLGVTIWMLWLGCCCAIAFLGYKIIIGVVEAMKH